MFLNTVLKWWLCEKKQAKPTWPYAEKKFWLAQSLQIVGLCSLVHVLTLGYLLFGQAFDTPMNR